LVDNIIFLLLSEGVYYISEVGDNLKR